MAHLFCLSLVVIPYLAFPSYAQQQCYYGPGAENRAPASLVPCTNDGQSACCLLGDICLSGNSCWNFETGNTYQYGCTDVTYTDEVCPYKCGFNTTLSPWIALVNCVDPPGVRDTWACHAPESCGCEWNSTTDLLRLEPRGCQAMGSNARVAFYAPTSLAPYVSRERLNVLSAPSPSNRAIVPKTHGGETKYFSPMTDTKGSKTWSDQPVSDYTPTAVSQLTMYSQPTSVVLINAKGKASPSTNSAAASTTATTTPSSADATNNGNTTSRETLDSQGLSIGAKAGIGAGIAAFVLALAAAASFLLLRRRRRSQPPQIQQNPYPFPAGTPMQTSPYSAQQEKDSWQAYSVGSSPPVLSPQSFPTYSSQFSHPDASFFMDSRSPKPESGSPPMELSAERHVHELQSGEDDEVGRREGEGK